ncbi:MAG: HEPN domain-containing protein [Lachnospiraceae bacterium]|nr:HEPN domain-containing protein [Lachnospiraceae bacterium]
MHEKVKYWIDLAEYDLETAKAMLDTKRYLYVGFMCHQTIEKGLKAVIAKTGDFPPKIHNLIELSKKASLYYMFSDTQKDFIMDLNPLNIESRYPSYVEKINAILTETKCIEILSKTKELLQWIETKL